MTKFAQQGVCALMLALVTSTVQAGALYCNGGTVAQLSHHGKGTLYLRMSNMNSLIGICSFDADWQPAGSLTGATTPSTGKAIYAALLATKLAGNSVKELLFDGDNVAATCTSFTPWTAVNLRFYDI